MADIAIDIRSGDAGEIKKTEEEVIKEAFSRQAFFGQIRPHVIFQNDGSMEIGWNSPLATSAETINFIIKFKDGKLDVVEMKKS